MGSDSKNGVRHQRALSPRLSMMMMMKKFNDSFVTNFLLNLSVKKFENRSQFGKDMINIAKGCFFIDTV